LPLTLAILLCGIDLNVVVSGIIWNLLVTMRLPQRWLIADGFLAPPFWLGS
jgi:hypothetical protein